MLCAYPAKWNAVWKKEKEKDRDFRQFIDLGVVGQTSVCTFQVWSQFGSCFC